MLQGKKSHSYTGDILVITFVTVLVTAYFSEAILFFCTYFYVPLKMTTIIALGGYFKFPAPEHFIFIFMIFYDLLENLWKFDGVLKKKDLLSGGFRIIYLFLLSREVNLMILTSVMSFCFKYLLKTFFWGGGGCLRFVISINNTSVWVLCGMNCLSHKPKLNKYSSVGCAKPVSKI